jgi:hypothetical protein
MIITLNQLNRFERYLLHKKKKKGKQSFGGTSKSRKGPDLESPENKKQKKGIYIADTTGWNNPEYVNTYNDMITEINKMENDKDYIPDISYRKGKPYLINHKPVYDINDNYDIVEYLNYLDTKIYGEQYVSRLKKKNPVYKNFDIKKFKNNNLNKKICVPLVEIVNKDIGHINIDLYETFLENYGLTSTEAIHNLWGTHINSAGFLLFQLKWFACYCMLFYLDFLHDFTDIDRTKIKVNSHLYKFLYKKMYDIIVKYVIDTYDIVIESPIMMGNSNLPTGVRIPDKSANKHDKIECIFYGMLQITNVTRNYEGDEFVTEANCEEVISGIFYDFNYIQKNGLRQEKIQIYSEYCLAIMGIQKLEFNRIQKTITNDNNTSYDDFTIKNILHINNFNGYYKETTKFLVGVDAMSGSGKTTQITNILRNVIKYNVRSSADLPDIYYLSTNIDILDAAVTENEILKILSPCYQKNRDDKDRNLPTNTSILHAFFNSDFKLVFNFRDIQNNVLRDSSNNILPEIKVMDFQISNGRARKNKLKINEYFGLKDNNLDSDDIPKTDKKPNEISLVNVVKWMELTPSNDFNTLCLKSSYKTVLDFLKVLYFWCATHGRFDGKGDIPENFSKSKFTDMFILNDIVAGDKAAVFIPSTVLAELSESYTFNQPFRMFLRSHELRKLKKTDQFNPVNVGGFGKKRVKNQ